MNQRMVNPFNGVTPARRGAKGPSALADTRSTRGIHRRLFGQP